MPISKNEIKFIKSLQQKKNRDAEGLFVVEGTKLVSELLLQSKFKIKTVYCTADCDIQINPSVNSVQINQSDLGRTSSLKNPNQILAIVYKEENVEVDNTQDNLILVLDGIKDPGNLGTIIRTADWFGIKQIICSTNSVEQYNSKVIQSSMGAIFRCQLIYVDLENELSKLSADGYSVYGADMNGKNAFEVDFEAKSVIVMGSESHGISNKIKDRLSLITIPKKGESESLNVAIAAGILIGQYAKNKV